MKTLILFVSVLLLNVCTVTSYSVEKVEKGRPISLKAIPESGKGPIHFQKIISADWEVERSGLINLEDPKAKAAGLKPGPEPIQIYFYVLEHPEFGTYVVDTGLADIFRKKHDSWPISSLVASQMNMDALKVRTTLGEWQRQSGKKIQGVFFTHLHLDHVMGGQDLDRNLPLFVGPTEASDRGFLNMFVQGSTDKLLGKDPNLTELTFSAKPAGGEVIDFFGDGSLLVIYSPGHTSGSMAFLVKSTQGAQLIAGDTCHTKWGWDNGVTPGNFTKDQEKNKKSLELLQELANRFQNAKVHPGHQSL